MNIAILSRNPKLYSTRRLLESIRGRGYDGQIIDAMHCTLEVGEQGLFLSYHGKPLPVFDAVIPRVGGSISSYTIAVLRQFELMGIFSLNHSANMTLARDKLHSLQMLSAHNIPVPHTAYTHHATHFHEVIDKIGGAPMIIKPLKGTQGSGVLLAESNKTAQTMLETLKGLRGNFLVQKYISEANGADLRCFVVGNEVIAAIKRQGADGEFRSNLHLGGTAVNVEISALEKQTAIKVAEIMGLNVCGVDILQSNHGPVVMEVNSTPGLEGIETTTGVDVSDKIIEFIEKAVGR